VYLIRLIGAVDAAISGVAAEATAVGRSGSFFYKRAEFTKNVNPVSSIDRPHYPQRFLFISI
jgi:hypothetical protein